MEDRCFIRPDEGFTKIVVVCSDGKIRTDEGGPTRDDYGQVDKETTWLTDEKLNEAPGWAFAPFRINGFGYRIPEGLEEAGKIVFPNSEGIDYAEIYGYENARVIGNNVLMISGNYFYSFRTSLGILDENKWTSFSEELDQILEIPPVSGFGDNSCTPIAADFDGDGLDDRAVQCPEGWKIAYSGENFKRSLDENKFRNINLTHDQNVFTLPGKPYYGGISYTHAVELMESYMESHPGEPAPISIDMVKISL